MEIVSGHCQRNEATCTEIQGRPWKRRKQYPDYWPHHNRHLVLEHSFRLPFFFYEDANMDMDIFLKNAALVVAPSVVSIITYSGEQRIFCGSGTIIGCDKVNCMYHAIILSSATLVRCPTRKNDIAENIKIDVRLSDGKFCAGQILACDMHYNLLLMKIQSDVQLATASLTRLDDSVKVGLSQVFPPGDKSFQTCHNSNLFNILPGEILIAVGRYFVNPYNLMAAAGFFSIECCRFDCKELLRVNCKISECGIGGPVVNRYGEVIGMNFYAEYYTPFLPINVALKWLEHYEKNAGIPRPQLGMHLANLYTADVEILEKVIQKFPNISEGVIVEKVEKGSPVDTAGICPNDVLVQCSGGIVRSLLQMFEISWEKVGESVELVVVRPEEGARLSLSVVVAENGPDKLNRWWLPKEIMRTKLRC